MVIQKLALYANLRTAYLFLFYLVICVVSFWLAYEMRFDFVLPDNHLVDRKETIWWVIPIKMLALLIGRQFDSILPYFRFPDAMRLFSALLGAAVFMVALWYWQDGKGAATARYYDRFPAQLHAHCEFSNAVANQFRARLESSAQHRSG